MERKDERRREDQKEMRAGKGERVGGNLLSSSSQSSSTCRKKKLTRACRFNLVPSGYECSLIGERDNGSAILDLWMNSLSSWESHTRSFEISETRVEDQKATLIPEE